MSIKGYPSAEKLDRLSSQFATVEPIRNQQFGLSVLSHMFVRVVGTDSVDSAALSVITASAHAALVGDVIRFTSGTYSGYEVKVSAVATNTITLAETLTPAVGVTFQILRHKYPVVDATGALTTTSSTPGFNTQYLRNAADQVVTEDTGTPSNNRPFPVKLLDASGNINQVAATQSGTWNIATVTAVTAISSALPAGNNNIGDVDVASLPGTVAADISDIEVHTDATATATALLATTVSAGRLLTTAAQSGTWNIGTVTTVTTVSTVTAVTAITNALPAGSNTIGKVDVNRLTVVDFIDTTPMIDATTLNGSGGALVVAVATLAAAVKQVQFNSTADKFIGLYVGPNASEVLYAVFPPGSDITLDLTIAASARVTLRSMETAAPTTGGSIAINFLG